MSQQSYFKNGLQLQLKGETTQIEMFVIPVSVAHQAVLRCGEPLKAWWTLLCCVVVVCCQQQQCCINQHHVQLGLLSCSQRRSPFMSCLALQAGGGRMEGGEAGGHQAVTHFFCVSFYQLCL